MYELCLEVVIDDVSCEYIDAKTAKQKCQLSSSVMVVFNCRHIFDSPASQTFHFAITNFISIIKNVGTLNVCVG